MSEISTSKRFSKQSGQSLQQRSDTPAKQRLFPEWVGEYGIFLALGALIILGLLSRAAKVLTWPPLLFILATIAMTTAWIWFLIARHRRAEAAVLRQQELYVLSTLERIDTMTGTEFEKYIAELLGLTRHRGVQVVGGKNDGGVDIVSTNPSGEPMAYQCKRQKDRVPIKVVRELIGSLAHEHQGRRGVIVTSAELTRDAQHLARDAGIKVIDRGGLADWMGEVRAQIKDQSNESASDLHWISRTSLGWVVVILMILSSALYAIASARSTAATAIPAKHASLSSARRDGPAAVVRADFAAINRHAWKAVWQLWRHRAPGYGAAYRKMIYGYRITARDVLTSLNVDGDTVTTHLLAYETTGPVQTYDCRFVVQDGTIRSGRCILRRTSKPSSEKT